MRALAFVVAGALGAYFFARGRVDRAAAEGGELAPGQWYRVSIRTELDARVFGGDAQGQRAQAALGRQGFRVRFATPDPLDPYVVHVLGELTAGAPISLASTTGAIVLAVRPTGPPAVMHGGGAPTYLDARPVPVEPGATYFGRASVSFPASLVVTRAAVRSRLEEHGFRDVAVYMAPEELPADWPAAERGGDVFVRATFGGGSPTTFDVPPQVQSVWTLGGPPT